ncbi:uncharacterized protein [Aegilops tauschii subsp. strangulata]|uniref:uncharacterized protein n=1 Tax=Aegilops tauschii subsp. strangulata TaxID=200361 RepID=UPI003CC859D5
MGGQFVVVVSPSVCSSFLMELAILDWNVRGLNNPAKRTAVASFVADKGFNIICLQETKLAVISRHLVVETLGVRFGDNFIFKPADGTRGGILIACSADFSVLQLQTAPNEFSLSATISDRTTGNGWTITAVYGPQRADEKRQFLDELRVIKDLADPAWLILGDFNLIARSEDKSNGNINIRMMGRFRAFIADLELRDLPLLGRRYTWCN